MKTLTIKRVFDDDISLIEGYISSILTLSGVHIPKPLISVLAHSVKYGKLDAEIKREIAERTLSDVQVVSNNITKLRKMKLLIGNKTIEKLQTSPGKLPVSLNLVMDVKKA